MILNKDSFRMNENYHQLKEGVYDVMRVDVVNHSDSDNLKEYG